MNKFFKASLLAIVFVGMSSFSDPKIEVDETVELGSTCEDQAALAYFFVEALSPQTTQAQLNNVFALVYWSCIFDDGDSDYTANPK